MERSDGRALIPSHRRFGQLKAASSAGENGDLDAMPLVGTRPIRIRGGRVDDHLVNARWNDLAEARHVRLCGWSAVDECVHVVDESRVLTLLLR